jgi:uncharacterized protein
MDALTRGLDFDYGREVRRYDLTFESRGTRCDAWLYRPHARAPVPCVVMAHGFDGVREQRLDAYAECFAAAGLAALVFDYRGFGASEGNPRQLFHNKGQLADWRAAIACARALEDAVDPTRIALWGTSTSAGHVVQLAGEDDRIAAVVAQIPLVDGLAQLRATPIWQSIRLLWAGLRDRVRALAGRDLKIPAAGPPDALAAVTSPDALSGLARMTPPGSTWRNEVLARFTLTTAFYRPGRWARRVSCPLLVCLADGDLVIPLKPALKLVRAFGHAELRRYPIGHFAMYTGKGFERAVSHQTGFLCRCLAGGLDHGPAEAPHGREHSHERAGTR